MTFLFLQREQILLKDRIVQIQSYQSLLLQRLAALVPRPRLHLIRFHGVLAPNTKLRSQVVPVPAQQTTKGEGDCDHARSLPVRMTWARLLKRVFDIDIEQCA